MPYGLEISPLPMFSGLLKQPSSSLRPQEDASVSGTTGAPHGPGGDHRERVGTGARRLPAAHLRGAVRGQPQRGHPAAGLPHHRGEDSVGFIGELMSAAPA